MDKGQREVARSRKVSRQKGDIMRDVLISLKPYYYYLIGEGIKKVEVRKTYPKADDWSRNSWFYMSRDEKNFAKIPKEFQEKYRKHFGKVGMRFVCDRIDTVARIRIPCMEYTTVNDKRDVHFCEISCLNGDELGKYLGFNKDGYGWHITDLVVYDKPRELSEFEIVGCQGCRDKDTYHCKFHCFGRRTLKRPPQSWCYIEPRQTAD